MVEVSAEDDIFILQVRIAAGTHSHYVRATPLGMAELDVGAKTDMQRERRQRLIGVGEFQHLREGVPRRRENLLRIRRIHSDRKLGALRLNQFVVDEAHGRIEPRQFRAIPGNVHRFRIRNRGHADGAGLLERFPSLAH